MASANGSRTASPRLLDLAVIDDSDMVGWLAGASRLSELYMTDVASMVAAVQGRCASIPGAKLRRLDIIDHGNPVGIQIGKDWIDLPRLGRFAHHFRTLGQLFTPKGFVHLQHCLVGQNHALLAQISALVGVPVYAGTGLHNPLYRFNRGNYERCVPAGSCESDVARP